MRDPLTGPTVDLLQTLIRNACVNDGTAASGGEVRNADVLTSYLEGPGVEIERFEPLEGRTSIVARVAGTDPDAPRLCLMGHTDVVPVNRDGWSHDPFGGELIDGEVWGRGAIDMLNVTASMAVTFKHLVSTGFRPRGDLIYFAVADEEAAGTWGARWIADHRWDAIECDYLLTELGGWSSVAPDGQRHVVVNVGEKGLAWRRLRVHGTPGHGSMPFGADNALIKAAEIVRRIAEHRPAARIDDIWREQVAIMDLPADQRAGLLDPERIWATLEELPVGVARGCHASTHTTFSPNVVHGGQKTNTVHDVVDLVV
jgi:acetylornithine deacetylase/succinyl-diaminopimelate desuccinylase-like protein